MNDPVTAIDTRFSDPDAHATAWDETRRALESAELFWISTVRADGRPHVTPLVAVWLDGALHFTTGATEQKALNLQHDPHVILTTGCNTWDQGLDVVVEGDALEVTDNASARTSRRRVGHEVGRPLAIQSARRQLSARGRRGPRLLGVTDQRARIRQGPLQSNPAPLHRRPVTSACRSGRQAGWMFGFRRRMLSGS